MRFRGVLLASSFAASFLIAGCNALLGTEEGTSGARPGNTADAGPGAGGDGNGGHPDPNAPDSGPSPRNDSKPPCEVCTPELVVHPSGHAFAVRVAGNYVYWSDYAGVHRVVKGGAACLNKECQEDIAVEQGDGNNVAATDKTVCWSTFNHFGCADAADLTQRKEVAGESLGLIGSPMRLDNDTIYFVQGTRNYLSPDTLVRGSAAGIAAGTSALGNVSSQLAIIRAFTLSGTQVAWTEGDDGFKLNVKPLAGGPTTSIPIPTDIGKSNSEVRDVALYGDYVYLFPQSTHVYRAPITGSEEAKPFLAASFVRRGIVNSGGIYVASANGFADGAIRWAPLDPTVKGAVEGKVLATTAGPVVAMDVADDGIYFLEDRAFGSSAGVDVGQSLWHIKFE